ncbi:MAG: ATP-binding protein [Butyribacter sp.]|nr:ATP-binding protein [Butyribacter sp.]
MSVQNVSYEELCRWEPKTYTLIDIREESAIAYGMIPEAISIPMERMEERKGELPRDRKLVIYCTKGILSEEVAESLQKEGFDAYSLSGGYYSFLTYKMQEDLQSDREKKEHIELSIRKKFHKELFSRFTKAINTYELVQENDHIAVCISGGKDSMLMAKLFQELKKHNKFNFELTFLVMDPGYSRENRNIIEQNARLMGIPITIFESNIFDTVDTVEKSPCYLCARMRRGYLYNKAKELGCNKIALGHHYDDVIETILMGMLYGAQVQTMMPKLHSTNFEGMELIRPLYLIREEDIKRWRDYNELHFLQCACHFTDTCSSCREDGTSNSKRLEIKKLISRLKEINPYVESNIFKSVENVNLSTVIAYKQDGVKHHFLETYDGSK